MRYLLPLVFLCTVSCHSKTDDEKFADRQYADFIKYRGEDSINSSASIGAEYVAQFHYDSNKRKEASLWLERYHKYFDELDKKDSIEKAEVQNHINSLGGVTELEIDSHSKCNLYKGYYLLNKKVEDSSELAFLVKHLASLLFRYGKKDTTCPWPLMSAAYLYTSKKDYDDELSIASCSITPTNYSGYVSVNPFLLGQYKKHNKQ